MERQLTAGASTEIRPLAETDLAAADRIFRLAFGTFVGLPDPLASVRASSPLSEGGQSPPFFGVTLRKIATALPHAQHHLYRNAGHVRHLTHADEFVKVVSGFVNSAVSARQ
jgi:pimeloyl-ACP methyl ester carboxylesterase